VEKPEKKETEPSVSLVDGTGKLGAARSDITDAVAARIGLDGVAFVGNFFFGLAVEDPRLHA
jgi:hypothetical protein